MATSKVDKIARSFIRLGWSGVWIQLILAVIPLFMLFYALSSRTTPDGLEFQWSDYLALFGLCLLLFTTFWSFCYARLGNRIEDPQRRPRRFLVEKTLWVGLWASCLGIVVSILLLLTEVTRLLFLLLKAPQGGVPVFRTEAADRKAWVSTIDVVSLLAELCTLTGELIVLGFTLWLLFRVLHAAVEYDKSLEGSH